LKILIIGGTVFLGRHVTQALLSRGHEVTLFNRGHHNPLLFPSVEKLRGDRDKNLSSLSCRSWDAVIDTCGYFPRQVAATAQKLHLHAPLYAFISSVNQYANFSIPAIDETHPGSRIKFKAEPSLTPETYGPLKAACESVVRQIYPEGALIFRPGCMVGPYDQAHRFTYWVKRTAAGGHILVPGRPEQPWQVIDVRDVAEWVVRMLETRRIGTFNVVGASNPYTAHQLIRELTMGTDSIVQPIWVDTQFLHALDAERWLDLAEWAELPPNRSHLYAIDNSRAIKEGLTFRPLAETVRDVRAWLPSRPPYNADALELDRERDILRAWKQKIAAKSSAEIYAS